jgi:predicted enzyme related to lactoylglutathione lyase
MNLTRHPCIWLAGAALLFSNLGVCAGEPPPIPPLTTASGNPRLPGKFVWADLVTDDAAGALKFYSALFGWTFHDYGGYFIGRHQDRPLCGIFQRPRPKDGLAQPRWLGYISVKSVGRAESAVTKAGGRVLAPARKMPDRGEQAVFADAEGALFGVVKSSGGDPEDFLAEPGEWIWIQLLSRDPRKAAEFYRAVAGYEIVENTSAGRMSDYVLTSERFARATVRLIRSADPKLQPTWLPFVRVNSVGESAARAKQLGGKTLIEAKPELFQGKVAVIADHSGAAIGLLEWSGEMKKGGG